MATATQSRIHFACAGCGKSLTAGTGLAGKRLACPACRQEITIPVREPEPFTAELLPEPPPVVRPPTTPETPARSAAAIPSLPPVVENLWRLVRNNPPAAVAAILGLGIGALVVSFLAFALMDFGPRPSDEEVRAAFQRISNLDPDLVELQSFRCRVGSRYSEFERERIEVVYTATLLSKAHVMYGPSDAPWRGALWVEPYSLIRMQNGYYPTAHADEEFPFRGTLVFSRVGDEPWRHLAF